MPASASRAVGQVRLPGQAAAPDGPVDLTAMFAMHWAFRRDLDRFVAAVAATPVADRAAWRALVVRWNLFREILHDHHTGEDDGLWPALLARLDQPATDASKPDESEPDRAARRVLAAMSAEHHDIDPLLDSVTDALTDMARPVDTAARAAPDDARAAPDDARAALEVRVVAARNRLCQHLSHEEREALTLVQRHLTPADWERISRTHFVRPKSLRQTVAVLAWVMHELPDAAATRLMTGAAPVRILWQLALRRPFASRERRAFRYTTR